MTLFSTGGKSNYQNGVLRARFTKSSMATRTKHALRYFKDERLPMIWLLDPYSTPAGLGRFLETQGLTPKWEIPCMAMYLNRLRRRPLPAGFSVRPVKDVRSLGVCVATTDKAFGGRDDGWREVYMGLGLGPSKRWATGFLDGRPVATSLLLLQGGFATVWIVGVLKKARGLGIGTAMTREALLTAKSLGYDLGIIQASEMGLPMYRKMGFTEYSRIKTCFWTPE